MRLIKQVPTEPGLLAASAAAEAHGFDAFRNYADGRDLFDETQMSIEQVQRVIASSPDTPMARAWAERMRAAVVLAEADDWRGYDQAEFSATAQPVVLGILDLADEARAASPLLATVADAIVWFTSDCDAYLDDFAERLAGLTPDHVTVTTRDNHLSTKHPVPWTHIEPIMPGLRDRLTTLVEALYAGLPTIAVEVKAGASRTP